MELKFKLTRPAKKNGGDRYEHGTEGSNDFMVIYVPQFISRENGEVRKELTITFD